MKLEYPNIPTATYRLQFNNDFTFQKATEIVPYLYDLGISHVYSSPYFQARAESTHGYDIVDHSRLNDGIGTREEFDEFVRTLHAHGMNQILDFVPNHMGIGEPLNYRWMDVLENGPSSRYATFFDIDFDPLKEELENKVLLPILGDQYGRILERGELRLDYEHGAFFLYYYDHKLPLNPRSYQKILKLALDRLEKFYEQDFYIELQSIMTSIEHLPVRTAQELRKIEERAREKEIVKRRLDRLTAESAEVGHAIQEAMRTLEGKVGDPRSFDALDELIELQPYRLAYWRVASEEINYRRFFDVNELAAIRVERLEVFEAAHQLVFELLASGAITGLRIDHVDGLWDPSGYLWKVQERSREILNLLEGENVLYLLVEKILAGNEQLRSDWPVHGTTGYEFNNAVTRLLIDPSAKRAMSGIYDKFIGGAIRFDQLVYEKKKETMELSLASEINVLAYTLDRLSEKNRLYRDFTLNSLKTVLREVIASFPVYRTYLLAGHEVSDEDRAVIQRAVNAARRRNPAVERTTFQLLHDILLMKFPEDIDEKDLAAHADFVMKFQQCTGPIMAKGLEDTAFYIYNRLVALNEVGGEPQVFGSTTEAFHEENVHRLASHPHSMLTTSTHDTKRGEDVRARIAAISEMPAVWRGAVNKWRTATKRFKTELQGEEAPNSNEEFLLYQILLGTWPVGGPTAEMRATYVTRIQDYMTKAIKEAKVNSSWIQPNEEWEEASNHFIASILDPRKGARFLKEFIPVANRIAPIGAINSITQTVLKLTVPGVPDIYQGCEIWDDSLVDPDNRRQVDYNERRKLLRQVDKEADPADLLKRWSDGRIKLFVTCRLLRFRREHPAIFGAGAYIPIAVKGTHSENVIAFCREHASGSILVIVPRLSSHVGTPPVGFVWEDTVLEWTSLGSHKFVDLFTNREMTSASISELLGEFPAAVLAALD
jgi:(1->4)-alpha-D-glucan 1-alpha-D-glucosylmutase